MKAFPSKHVVLALLLGHIVVAVALDTVFTAIGTHPPIPPEVAQRGPETITEEELRRRAAEVNRMIAAGEVERETPGVQQAVIVSRMLWAGLALPLWLWAVARARPPAYALPTGGVAAIVGKLIGWYSVLDVGFAIIGAAIGGVLLARSRGKSA